MANSCHVRLCGPVFETLAGKLSHELTQGNLFGRNGHQVSRGTEVEIHSLCTGVQLQGILCQSLYKVRLNKAVQLMLVQSGVPRTRQSSRSSGSTVGTFLASGSCCCKEYRSFLDNASAAPFIVDHLLPSYKF